MCRCVYYVDPSNPDMSQKRKRVGQGHSSSGGKRQKREMEQDRTPQPPTQPPGPLAILAEVFTWEKAATSGGLRLSWREQPKSSPTTSANPPPHPKDSQEERIKYCKRAGVPPMEEDWPKIKQSGDLKECMQAIIDRF